MDLSAQFGDSEIKFEVKFRYRKTLAIQVTPPGKVTVLSPFGLSEAQIRNKVASKEEWIIKKLLHFKNIENICQKRKLADSGTLMYLGSSYPVIINYETGLKWLNVKFFNDSFIIDTPTGNYEVLKKLLEKWYRKEAEKIIMQRVGLYILKYKTVPEKIKVKEQKKRWGTCTSKGNIYFNWRLIMAPLHVIDYVIIHELSHLVHPDHSPLFWKHVGSIIPDYRIGKKWLKDNGFLLDL